MSEGLEALKELRYRITNFNGEFNDYSKIMNIIEKELKDYKEIKENVMSNKDLEASKEIKEFRIVDKKFLEVTYVGNCNLTRIDLEAAFAAKVVEEKNEQKYSSEGLEALKYLDEHNLNWHDNPTKKRVAIIKEELEDYETFKTGLILGNMSIVDNKILKTLEIIKEKRVDISWFYYSDNDDKYNSIMEDSRRYLTQEEYDLLKEVL